MSKSEEHVHLKCFHYDLVKLARYVRLSCFVMWYTCGILCGAVKYWLDFVEWLVMLEKHRCSCTISLRFRTTSRHFVTCFQNSSNTFIPNDICEVPTHGSDPFDILWSKWIYSKRFIFLRVLRVLLGKKSLRFCIIVYFGLLIRVVCILFWLGEGGFIFWY